MSVKSEQHVVIVGNGISGVTCARQVRKENEKCDITIISSETDYFFSRTALMYIFMGHMKFEHTKPYEDWFWKKNRINLVRNKVVNIDFNQKILHFEKDSTPLAYTQLVLALGSTPNKFGWPGQDLNGAQGLYSFQDLEKLETNAAKARHAVIVGGGLIGIEFAEMMLSRNIGVSFLVRENSFWSNVLPIEESRLISRHILEHGVDLQLSTELKSIESLDGKNVSHIISSKNEKIDCQIVGLTAGVSPNISFLKESELATDKGILVNEFFETNQKDVFAIGDCAQFTSPPEGRRALEQVWYTGKNHGAIVAKNICGQKSSYRPGNWFNSAKFFDIEYQTYGWVNNTLADHEQSFYWESSSGKICFRAVWHKKEQYLIGINTLGIRMRHDVFDNWLNEKRSIDFVMENLQEANFDPEFYKLYEPEIIASYNTVTNRNVPIKAKINFLQKIFS